MILCVAGNPSIDKLFEVQECRVGEIHRPEHFIQLPGGKGIHVAQVATVLGGASVVTGLLAGHAGRWIAETLDAEGVEGRFTWGVGETRSSLSVADRATGRLTEFYEAGTSLTPQEWQAVKSIVLSLLPRASWVAIAGSLPPGVPVDGYAELMEMSRRAGVPVALDSRGDALAHAISAEPEVVKINVHEAGELLGESISGLDQTHAAARRIRAQAGGQGHAAVITRGEEGVVSVDPSGAAWRGSLSARGRYPVGSGDAFLGGLLVGLERDASWPRAIALALGAAAANAELPGAALVNPKRVRQLAGEADVQALEGADLSE